MSDILSQIKRAEIAGRFFIGEVIENDDPMKRQRVQVRVPVLHATIADKDLPWAFNGLKKLQGASATHNTFSIPAKGTFLLVMFDNGDIYCPMFFGSADSAISLQQIPGTSYKDTYGIVDTYGNKIYVDTSNGTIRIDHASGSFVNINSGGNVSIYSVGNITQTADGDVTISCSEATVEASGDANVQGANVSVTASGNAEITATGNVNVTGALVNLN